MWNGEAEPQDLNPIPDEVVRAVYQHEFAAILWLGGLAKYMWAAWGCSLLALIFVLVFVGGAES